MPDQSDVEADATALAGYLDEDSLRIRAWDNAFGQSANAV